MRSKTIVLLIALFINALCIFTYFSNLVTTGDRSANGFMAVLPIICAFLFSVIKGGSMFYEGSGGGSYLWFLMASLPIGLLFIVIGLIVKLAKHFKS